MLSQSRQMFRAPPCTPWLRGMV